MKKILIAAGVLCLVSTAVILGQTRSQQPIVARETGPGRYQIVINPEMRADAFLLDTQTGRIWQRVHYSQFEHSADVWEFRERLDNSDEVVAWEKRQNFVEEAWKNAKKQDQKQ